MAASLRSTRSVAKAVSHRMGRMDHRLSAHSIPKRRERAFVSARRPTSVRIQRCGRPRSFDPGWRGLALGKAVADSMRSAGRLWWKFQGSDDRNADDQQLVAPRDDFMRNLGPCVCFGSSGFVLRGLWGRSDRSNGLSDRGAGADALSERYRRLARPPERALLPQGTRVIWSLECGPLRLSYRSRRRGHARDAQLTRSGCCCSSRQ